MDLQSLITTAKNQGASDLHLEPGLPPALRIRGTLKVGSEPVSQRNLYILAQEIIGHAHWPQFLERRSFDLSKTIAGVRCRINILQTARGVGLAVRLLSSFQASIEKLNLHPDLRRFVAHPNGLILVSGPTGSGKSTTLAALVQEINLTEARHIITLESPIEYNIRPRQSYIRQREVGRDTPSFEQALLDALREDPDVLMVGEMRDPETMRLTLNAAETGHLVLATVHSGSCVEALQRIVSAFPAESQSAVCAQLADCLIGVITQRLRYRADLSIRVPECEIAVTTHPVKAHIRNREFYKIVSAMETGAESGMWTFQRYNNWLQNRSNWFIPKPFETEPQDPESANGVDPASAEDLLPTTPKSVPASSPVAPQPPRPEPVPSTEAHPIEIEPVEGGLQELIKKLGQ